MAICKRCGKEIKFIKTKKGKWLPVEQEMVVIIYQNKKGKMAAGRTGNGCNHAC